MKTFTYSKNDDYILNEDEQQEIVNWIKNNYKKLQPNGFNIYNGLIENLDIPQIIWNIKNRIIQREELQNAKQDPLYKDSICYMFDGSQLPIHSFKNDNQLVHTRFNVYVKLPEIGGYPIYDGKVLRLKERTYICYRMGIETHCCQKVYGNRIILSFGFLLPLDRVKNIIYDYDDLNYILDFNKDINILKSKIITDINITEVNKYNEIDGKNLLDLTKIKVLEQIDLEKFINYLKIFSVECSKNGTSDLIKYNYLLNDILENKNIRTKYLCIS